MLFQVCERKTIISVWYWCWCMVCAQYCAMMPSLRGHNESNHVVSKHFVLWNRYQCGRLSGHQFCLVVIHWGLILHCGSLTPLLLLHQQRRTWWVKIMSVWQARLEHMALLYFLCPKKKGAVMEVIWNIGKHSRSYKTISEISRAHSQTLRTTLIEDQFIILRKHPSKPSRIPY